MTMGILGSWLGVTLRIALVWGAAALAVWVLIAVVVYLVVT